MAYNEISSASNKIRFAEILQIFDLENWDIGFLTAEDMMEVSKISLKKLNHTLPTMNTLTEKEYLVCIKKSISYDYSVMEDAINLIFQHFPQLDPHIIWVDYKYAAMKAGLGQYAKNSLIYSNKFGFECHIVVLEVNNLIIDYPLSDYNSQLLPMCIGCYDCIQNCPAQAIFYNGKEVFIDMERCDNLIQRGDMDKNIPSLQQQKQMDNDTEHIIGYPICSECIGQPKCSKYDKGIDYTQLKKIIRDKVIRK